MFPNVGKNAKYDADIYIYFFFFQLLNYFCPSPKPRGGHAS